MSSLEELDDMERHDGDQKNGDDRKEDGSGDDGDQNGKKPSANGASGSGGDAEMKDAEQRTGEEEEQIDAEILHSSTRDIINRRKLLENEMRINKSEFQRLTHEKNTMQDKIKENVEKIDNNRYEFYEYHFCIPTQERTFRLLTRW